MSYEEAFKLHTLYVFAPVRREDGRERRFRRSDVPTVHRRLSRLHVYLTLVLFSYFPSLRPSLLYMQREWMFTRASFLSSSAMSDLSGEPHCATETPIIHIKKYQHDNRKTFTHSRVISDYLLVNLTVSRQRYYIGMYMYVCGVYVSACMCCAMSKHARVYTYT